MATIEDFIGWVRRDLRHVDISTPEPGQCSAVFYTSEREYRVRACSSDSVFPEGRVSCSAAVRKPAPGEGMPRRTDIADGPMTEEAWRGIIRSVFAQELVRIYQPGPAQIVAAQDLRKRGATLGGCQAALGHPGQTTP